MFAWIANFCAVNVRVAHAFATVVAQLLAEMTDEVCWSDVMATAYYNVLFDPEVSAKFGTNFLCDNLHSLRQFVDAFDIDGGNPLPQITQLILPKGIQ